MKRVWTWLVDLWRVFVPQRSPHLQRKAPQTGYPPIPGDWPDPPERWRKPDWPPVAPPPPPPERPEDRLYYGLKQGKPQQQYPPPGDWHPKEKP
jgi:hypothetical protein